MSGKMAKVVAGQANPERQEAREPADPSNEYGPLVGWNMNTKLIDREKPKRKMPNVERGGPMVWHFK